MIVSKEFLSLLGSSLRSDLEKTMERISKTFDWDAATGIYEGKNIMNIVERLRERSSVALSEEDVTHFNQAADEIERLRKALEWIAGCEGGDIFDLWKEMRDTARAALQQKESE